jgi:hypothetical protein
VSNFSYFLMALFLGSVLVWQLVSGNGIGVWWYPRITRRDNPRAYWVCGDSSGRYPHCFSHDRQIVAHAIARFTNRLFSGYSSFTSRYGD